MLLNYIKIAIRNILRNKLHSFINIISLSIGMACAVLIMLYVLDELSFDKHNSKHDRIYLVESIIKIKDLETPVPRSAYILAPTLKERYPVVEEVARLHDPGQVSFKDRNGEIIGERGIRYADTSIFGILDHKFIYGSPEGALDAPHTIVLSETLSKKYFGDENPVGRILTDYKGTGYIVKGVFEDLPKKTTAPYDGLISMKDFPELFDAQEYNYVSTGFMSYEVMTFVLLRKNAGIENITGDFEKFKKKYFTMLAYMKDNDLDYNYIPYKDYHLHDTISSNLKFNKFDRICFLSALAFFILLIASINYMNLATARSMGRAKEVGVRKVLGADRGLLIRQFLSESVIITIIAMLIALVLVELALPDFNDLVFKKLGLVKTGSIAMFLCMVIITLIVGIIAGIYPAVFLSSFRPVTVFGKGSKSGFSKGRLRKILVVTQYSISIIMIICMILSIRQMNYVMNIDPGYNVKDIHYLILYSDELRKNFPVLERDLSNYSGISRVAKSSIQLRMFNFVINEPPFSVKAEDGNGEIIEKKVKIEKVDYDYIDMMEMKLIEGRSFSTDTEGGDIKSVIVNETFAKSMGWTDSPVGKRIVHDGKGYNMENYKGTYKIIGVIRDIRFDTLYRKAQPLVLMPGRNPKKDFHVLTFKVDPENSKETIEHVRKKLSEYYPYVKNPPSVSSLELDFKYRFWNERLVNNLLIWSAFFCVLISCLGFFGLSSFIAESKTKEIGIRKVNGATVSNIVSSLTGQFLKLVLISSIIACPIAYYAMSRWFENFTFRIGIEPWIFFIGVAIALIIAWLTVSYHSIKAAVADPVKALRYE